MEDWIAQVRNDIGAAEELLHSALNHFYTKPEAADGQDLERLRNIEVILRSVLVEVMATTDKLEGQ